MSVIFIRCNGISLQTISINKQQTII